MFKKFVLTMNFRNTLIYIHLLHQIICYPSFYHHVYTGPVFYRNNISMGHLWQKTKLVKLGMGFRAVDWICELVNGVWICYNPLIDEIWWCQKIPQYVEKVWCHIRFSRFDWVRLQYYIQQNLQSILKRKYFIS